MSVFYGINGKYDDVMCIQHNPILKHKNILFIQHFLLLLFFLQNNCLFVSPSLCSINFFSFLFHGIKLISQAKQLLFVYFIGKFFLCILVSFFLCSFFFSSLFFRIIPLPYNEFGYVQLLFFMRLISLFYPHCDEILSRCCSNDTHLMVLDIND